MEDALLRLLDQYPSSWLKVDAERLLREALRLPPSDRQLRCIVNDVVYAFQRLEARRLGLRPDRHPHQYAEFRRSFITSLAMWVPGKDRLADGLREAIAECAAGNLVELDALLHLMLKAAERQAHNGGSTRKLKTIDTYIVDLLKKKRRLTDSELWRQIVQDSEGLTDRRIGEIEPDGVWVIDPMPAGRVNSRFYSRSSLRSRLSRIRTKKDIS